MLHHLPNELIFIITDFLLHIKSFKLTCKKFYRLSSSPLAWKKRKVRLYFSNIPSKICNRYAKCVQHLYCYDTIRSASFISQFKLLETLSTYGEQCLYDSKNKITFASLLSSLPNLKSLSFTHTSMSKASTFFSPAISKLTTLETLELCHTTSAEANLLECLHSLPQLKKLNVTGSIRHEQNLQDIASLPNLQVLIMSRTEYLPLEKYAHLLVHLVELEICGKGIHSAIGATALAKSIQVMPLLQILDAQDNNFRSNYNQVAVEELLQEIAKHPALKNVNLMGNGIPRSLCAKHLDGVKKIKYYC